MCVCVIEKQSPLTFFSDGSKIWTCTKNWNKLTVAHTHACSHKSQCIYKGSDGLKEDPAGYYGMPGICWGNIGLPVWARRVWSVWIALFHSLPFLPTSEKRFGRREKKKKHGGGVQNKRWVCGATQERRVVFVCVAEGGVVPCPVQH